MIDLTDIPRLARLIQASEGVRDAKLDVAEERMKVAMGAMNEKTEGDLESPENLGFALYSILLPSMVTSSPVFQASSDGDAEERLQAAALGAAGTQMARKMRLHQVLEPCAWDFLMGLYGAMMVEKPKAKMRGLTQQERDTLVGRMANPEVIEEGDEIETPEATSTPRQTVPPHWVTLKRLHPRMCGFDAQVKTLGECRYTWHDVIISRALLEQRAKENSDDWYPDAVEALATHGIHELEEVMYRVVYVPGARLPDGPEPTPSQPGVILTISHTATDDGSQMGGGIEIRRPYYWEGHPGGPHVFEGQYTHGEDPFGLTLLTAHSDALQQLDAVSSRVHDRIRQHSVKYAYDASIQEEVEQLQMAEDGAWVPVPALRDGRVFERFETGEVSQAEVAELREAQINAQRALGIDDAAQGMANSDATATAVSVAANSTRTKVQYILSRWERFVREGMERMAWEIAHDDRVVIRLDERGREDVLRERLMPMVAEGEITRPGLEQYIQNERAEPLIYQGGDFRNEDNELDWYSLDIRIEPGSLDGSLGDQRVAKEIAWNQQLAQLGMAAMQMPFMDWHSRIRDTGAAFGFLNADAIFDRMTLKQMTNMMLAQGAMGQPSTASMEGADPGRTGATLREASGGARSPAGVDPGTFQES